MTGIIADLLACPDGFVTGPAPSPERDLDIDRGAPGLRRLPVIR